MKEVMRWMCVCVCVEEMGREDCDCEEVEEAKSCVVRQHSEREQERGVKVKHYRRHDDNVVVAGQHTGNISTILDSIPGPEPSLRNRWKALDVQIVCRYTCIHRYWRLTQIVYQDTLL
jgi:hypothetical protein